MTMRLPSEEIEEYCFVTVAPTGTSAVTPAFRNVRDPPQCRRRKGVRRIPDRRSRERHGALSVVRLEVGGSGGAPFAESGFGRIF